MSVSGDWSGCVDFTSSKLNPWVQYASDKLVTKVRQTLTFVSGTMRYTNTNANDNMPTKISRTRVPILRKFISARTPQSLRVSTYSAAIFGEKKERRKVQTQSIAIGQWQRLRIYVWPRTRHARKCNSLGSHAQREALAHDCCFARQWKQTVTERDIRYHMVPERIHLIRMAALR